MKINLYSTKLKKPSTFTLPKGVADYENIPLLAQAVHVYRDRQHPGHSKVKTRAEVDLTKAKWFKQKGTGRARHGAQSAPIFVGGGVAHGPTGIKRVLTMSKKMKQKALVASLTLKAKEGKVLAVSDLSGIKKTKEAQGLIKTISENEKTKNIRFTFVVSEKNRGVYSFLKNIEGVKFERYADLNAYKVYLGGKIVLDVDAFEPVKKAK